MPEIIISSQSPTFNPRRTVLGHWSSVHERVGTAGTILPEKGTGVVTDVMTIYDDYTVVAENFTILADCSVIGKDLTISLPNVHTVDELELNISKFDSTAYTVTIEPYGSQRINQWLNRVLRRLDANLTIIADADGGLWKVL
jgi:hypothetical protein